MAHITSIRFWSDPGFTEGCIEIPGLNYTLPTPSFRPLSVNGWRPAKNALFNKIKVEESFPDLINMSFLEAVYLFEDGTEMMFYGWIDNVSILSDDNDHPVTTIDWHIDYWMTYRQAAVFKYGLVKRRAQFADRPPQNPPYRFKKVQQIDELLDIDQNSVFWVYINYIHDQGTVTFRNYACIPTKRYISTYIKYRDEETPVSTISLSSIFRGLLDERYGIPPTQIISIFISPIPPMRVSGAGTSTDPFVVTNLNMGWIAAKKQTENLGEFGWFQWTGDEEETLERTYTLPTQIQTTDDITFVITDFRGEPIGTLPYGIHVKDYTVRIVNASTGGYLQIRFDGWQGGTEGLTFNVPLPSLDVTSNSWSSYVYSGQRQYDAQSKRLANDHALRMGGIMTISRAASGMTSGALLGGLGSGSLTAPGGALVGGMGEALGGVLEAGLGYLENTRYTDTLLPVLGEYHADQLESMLIYGDTLDWLWYGRAPSVVGLQIDDYSRDIFARELQLLGVKCSEPTADCQSLIVVGGPLQIENLIVGGNIPARAKDYIRDRFRRGVRLI